MQKHNQNGGGVIVQINNASLSVVVVGGKKSHLFLGGEDGWCYQPGLWYLVYPNSRLIASFLLRIYISLRTYLVRVSNHGGIFI